MRKYVLAVVAVLALGSSVQAGEPALAKLGLGGLEQISEKEGMQVRGLAASSFSSGTTSVKGLLMTDTSNYFTVESLLFGRSTDDNGSMPTDGTDTSGDIGTSAQVSHPLATSAGSLTVGSSSGPSVTNSFTAFGISSNTFAGSRGSTGGAPVLPTINGTGIFAP